MASTSASASRPQVFQKNGRPLTIFVPLGLPNRPTLVTAIRRHGGAVDARMAKCDIVIIDTDTYLHSQQNRELYRGAKRLPTPLPCVAASWITDSVAGGVPQNLRKPSYDPLILLDELDKREVRKAQTARNNDERQARMMAGEASRNPQAALLHQYAKFPGRAPYTAADRYNIVEHLAVTKQAPCGRAIGDELVAIFGRHTRDSYQSYLRDNYERGANLRAAVEQYRLTGVNPLQPPASLRLRGHAQPVGEDPRPTQLPKVSGVRARNGNGNGNGTAGGQRGGDVDDHNDGFESDGDVDEDDPIITSSNDPAHRTQRTQRVATQRFRGARAHGVRHAADSESDEEPPEVVEERPRDERTSADAGEDAGEKADQEPAPRADFGAEETGQLVTAIGFMLEQMLGLYGCSLADAEHDDRLCRALFETNPDVKRHGEFWQTVAQVTNHSADEWYEYFWENFKDFVDTAKASLLVDPPDSQSQSQSQAANEKDEREIADQLPVETDRVEENAEGAEKGDDEVRVAVVQPATVEADLAEKELQVSDTVPAQNEPPPRAAAQEANAQDIASPAPAAPTAPAQPISKRLAIESQVDALASTESVEEVEVKQQPAEHDVVVEEESGEKGVAAREVQDEEETEESIPQPGASDREAVAGDIEQEPSAMSAIERVDESEGVEEDMLKERSPDPSAVTRSGGASASLGEGHREDEGPARSGPPATPRTGPSRRRSKSPVPTALPSADVSTASQRARHHDHKVLLREGEGDDHQAAVEEPASPSERRAAPPPRQPQQRHIEVAVGPSRPQSPLQSQCESDDHHLASEEPARPHERAKTPPRSQRRRQYFEAAVGPSPPPGQLQSRCESEDDSQASEESASPSERSATPPLPSRGQRRYPELAVGPSPPPVQLQLPEAQPPTDDERERARRARRLQLRQEEAARRERQSRLGEEVQRRIAAQTAQSKMERSRELEHDLSTSSRSGYHRPRATVKRESTPPLQSTALLHSRQSHFGAVSHYSSGEESGQEDHSDVRQWGQSDVEGSLDARRRAEMRPTAPSGGNIEQSRRRPRHADSTVDDRLHPANHTPRRRSSALGMGDLSPRQPSSTMLASGSRSISRSNIPFHDFSRDDDDSDAEEEDYRSAASGSIGPRMSGGSREPRYDGDNYDDDESAAGDALTRELARIRHDVSAAHHSRRGPTALAKPRVLSGERSDTSSRRRTHDDSSSRAMRREAFKRRYQQEASALAQSFGFVDLRQLRPFFDERHDLQVARRRLEVHFDNIASDYGVTRNTVIRFVKAAKGSIRGAEPFLAAAVGQTQQDGPGDFAAIPSDLSLSAGVDSRSRKRSRNDASFSSSTTKRRRARQ